MKKISSKESYRHIPVMLDDVMEYLAPQKGQNFVDCTLGGGGYTRAMAQKIGKKGKILSIDLDEMAIANFEEKYKKDFENVVLANDNFRNLTDIVKDKFDEDIKFDGIVMDLGLSSAQLDDIERGFSFKTDAELNMAFGSKSKNTIRIINRKKQEELEKIIRDYGEERFARQITKAILKARKEEKIKTTSQLVEIIASAVPAKYRNNKKLHFATRTFQALRIATNDELNSISDVLPQAMELLKENGKIAVVSFHSLEDRIVKHFFKHESKDCICPPKIPLCVCEHKAKLKILTKKPILPSEEETKENPRARSAKLRVAQKI